MQIVPFPATNVCLMLRQRLYPPLTVLADVTINILPDDVLLDIFHFYRPKYGYPMRYTWSWKWQRLAHVCMRWRSVVFASPNFLDIKLDCTPWRPAEPVPIRLPFPIAIEDIKSSSSPQNYDLEAAIPHPDRVWQIDLQRITRSQFQQVASVIQKQFPALIHLALHLDLY